MQGSTIIYYPAYGFMNAIFDVPPLNWNTRSTYDVLSSLKIHTLSAFFCDSCTPQLSYDVLCNMRIAPKCFLDTIQKLLVNIAFRLRSSDGAFYLILFRLRFTSSPGIQLSQVTYTGTSFVATKRTITYHPYEYLHSTFLLKIILQEAPKWSTILLIERCTINSQCTAVTKDTTYHRTQL